MKRAIWLCQRAISTMTYMVATCQASYSPNSVCSMPLRKWAFRMHDIALGTQTHVIHTTITSLQKSVRFLMSGSSSPTPNPSFLPPSGDPAPLRHSRACRGNLAPVKNLAGDVHCPRD